ncbi:NAD binding oxidoreductase [Colletotrichum orchidophilum]|uniref:NAD binding oxidoreductase n=1 Tax=Colletotrichum orchidophilum TaxID=1209926 RepID=A0A1G4BF00_9PEZI|nr:NAD binding oxidoreductase [Colletotrichum orchidophilum]OHE99917.1 NAD binding oxidoreductase [Colletotrichum orchidophilum]
MALGTYNFTVMRMIFRQEPEESSDCDNTVFIDGNHDQCDYTFKTESWFPKGTSDATKSLPDSQEKVRTRLVTLHGFLHAVAWHRIDVSDSHEIRNVANGQTLRKWIESSSNKAYTY